jgi:hypothetical protein
MVTPEMFHDGRVTLTESMLYDAMASLDARPEPCLLCVLGTPHHPTASDLHVILVHDGVRFLECTGT